MAASMSPGLADWVEIIDAHNEKYGDEPRVVLELQPSEVDRLRHDLMEARRERIKAMALMGRYEDLLKRTTAMAEQCREEAKKALDLAKRFEQMMAAE